MNETICKFSSNYDILLFVAYMIIEGWLGRTDRVKAGSALELFLNVILAPFRARYKKK